MNKILCLSPHPDDITIGCGATINKFIEEGKEVWCVVFTHNDVQGFADQEIWDSITALGIPRDHIIQLDFKARTLAAHRQEILDKLVEFRTTLAPELVLVHRRDDVHQDHKVVSEEAFRAFKSITIWGYRLPWNVRDNEHYESVYKRNVDNKIRAMGFIKSQQQRHYYNPRKREANAIATGEEIGKDYAEKFEIISDIQ